MAEKNFKLFREKSMEAVESPESLNDYLRVTSPGVWVLLAAVIMILIGTVVWGVFGSIETSARVAVVSDGTAATCLIPYEAMDSMVKSPVVTVDGNALAVSIQSPEADVISDTTDVYTRLAGDYELGDVVYRLKMQDVPEKGTYTGIIVTENLRPISLLLR